LSVITNVIINPSDETLMTRYTLFVSYHILPRVSLQTP